MESEIHFDILNPTYLVCILQHFHEKVWIKLQEPCSYQDFVQKAQQLFPLNDVDFVFTDVHDARLDPDFLLEFVHSSERGVILKVKYTAKNYLDISNSMSTSSVISSVDTNILIPTSPTDNENAVELSEEKFEEPSCSKKAKIFQSDIISKEVS
ncbi:hypothetical protein PUN28_011834 [Cardiocondyla obscurior]|uniref:PB1 domain-containing protein n=1 Tax=Cardiocondyla obscurior TaxID=286306 RepID=A0AAW2FI54_9HYME